MQEKGKIFSAFMVLLSVSGLGISFLGAFIYSLIR
jgi:hypothetical protein